uniref:GRAS5 n=1 Tax=Tamarix hispida TaxID=189793 RepID=A0A2S1WLM8_9CARY|nr:GRAS5 [Tamarix hispida]
MLAGCSSTLLSPRHRLRSEASAQFQASCHFQLPSMSTQRLDLPCSFPRKDVSRSQSIRPVGLSVEKQIEAKTGTCSLKQSIRLPPSATTAQREIKGEFWQKGKSLKRLAEDSCIEESCLERRAKKRRGSFEFDDHDDSSPQKGAKEQLSLERLGSGNFWLQTEFHSQLNSVPFSLTCSGEEERVCFVPTNVIPPSLPPLCNNPWADSVVTQITYLGQTGGETGSGVVKETGSASSSSSDSQGLGFRLNENIPEHEYGNGSALPNPGDGATSNVMMVQNEDDRENQGLELVHLLLSCIEAITTRNVAAVHHYIARLGDLASPRDSPISRITAYFTEALALRVTRVWPYIFHLNVPCELDRVDEDIGNSLRLLNQVSPIPKFVHFTANEMLLRAFEGKDRIHVIDFDIKQGLQWPSFFQSLASRSNIPSHVRITGIGGSKQELIETGDRLAGLAEALKLPFEFHPVVDRLEDVRLWMLHVKEGESVAVNCVFQLHKTLYDGSGGALRDFLGLIRSTNPRAVVVAEQEADHNELNIEKRVCNALPYYSAIFDSISSSLPPDSLIRVKVEEMFAREIRNIIACEGSDRFERHEKFSKWRRLIEQGGFRCTGITETEMLQSRMLLKMYASEGYDVEMQREDNAAAAGLTLRWLDQPLYTVSAWSPIDVAGSSSGFSQPM